jgi:CheY-like chemotaxis protein
MRNQHAHASALHVLIVEGNENLLHALCNMLSTLGHIPRGAASGEAALDLLGAHQYDVLIAAATLPDLSGIELARAALRMMPCIKIIFSSDFGYLLSDRLEFDFAVLHRPYFLHQVVDALERSSDGRPSPI